jgi:hypothetical protein
MAFDPITITVELDDNVAAQLAQFCKRSTFDMFFDLTEAHLSHEERRQRAYMMISGIERVQAALAKAGHAPR